MYSINVMPLGLTLLRNMECQEKKLGRFDLERNLVLSYWEKNRDTPQYKNLPIIVSRRYERIEELKKKQMYFGGTIGCISFGAFLVIAKLSSIKRTYLRGIYYTPLTNSMDLHLHSYVGSKWINNIKPSQFEVIEKLANNNRIDKRFIVKDKSAIKGYSYFGYPSKSQWKGKDIFDAWFDEHNQINK